MTFLCRGWVNIVIYLFFFCAGSDRYSQKEPRAEQSLGTAHASEGRSLSAKRLRRCCLHFFQRGPTILCLSATMLSTFALFWMNYLCHWVRVSVDFLVWLISGFLFSTANVDLNATCCRFLRSGIEVSNQVSSNTSPFVSPHYPSFLRCQYYCALESWS